MKTTLSPWNIICWIAARKKYKIHFTDCYPGIYIVIKLHMSHSCVLYTLRFWSLLSLLWKLSILPPLWQCRSYFPPTLPLECLSMRVALPHLWMPPNTELARPLGTHTHIQTHTFCQKRCQADLRHVTILHHCLGPPFPLYPQTTIQHHAS